MDFVGEDVQNVAAFELIKHASNQRKPVSRAALYIVSKNNK